MGDRRLEKADEPVIEPTVEMISKAIAGEYPGAGQDLENAHVDLLRIIAEPTWMIWPLAENPPRSPHVIEQSPDCHTTTSSTLCSSPFGQGSCYRYQADSFFVSLVHGLARYRSDR